MVAAFTADYVEVINWFSVARGVVSVAVKPPEPESERNAAAQAGESRGFKDVGRD